MVKMVEQTVAMFRWALRQSHIKVHVDVQSNVFKLNGPAITQVISNLLDNAIRYYDGTGPIIIEGYELQTEYKLCITGPGKPITPDAQGQIFDRFYRTEPSRSRELGGSGLGLAISKEIIEQHQGTIGVTSEGNVHTFWFKLPRG